MALQDSEGPFPYQPKEPTPRLRASHDDREAVVQTLHDGAARGLLTLGETDERVAAAYASRFLDELPGLTADLPQPLAPSAPGAPGWQALMLLFWLQLRTLLSRSGWRDVRHGVRTRPRLAVAAVAAVALLALLPVAALTAGEGFDHRSHVEPTQEMGHR